MPNIFRIIFQDSSIFLGGESIKDSKWLEIPDKPISRLEYFLCSGEGIILEGFEFYLCFVEANSTIYGPVGNCPKCSSKGKLSKKITKYTNETFKQELIARCTKCDWVGEIKDLKYLIVPQEDKFIYIMGLKEGLVTSYRVSLKGKEGENKYQIGDITKRVLPLGQAYRGRETNKSLWKRGIIKN
jgi:hypothetical protein